MKFYDRRGNLHPTYWRALLSSAKGVIYRRESTGKNISYLTEGTTGKNVLYKTESTAGEKKSDSYYPSETKLETSIRGKKGPGVLDYAYIYSDQDTFSTNSGYTVIVERGDTTKNKVKGGYQRPTLILFPKESNDEIRSETEVEQEMLLSELFNENPDLAHEIIMTMTAPLDTQSEEEPLNLADLIWNRFRGKKENSKLNEADVEGVLKSLNPDRIAKILLNNDKPSD